MTISRVWSTGIAAFGGLYFRRLYCQRLPFGWPHSGSRSHPHCSRRRRNGGAWPSVRGHRRDLRGGDVAHERNQQGGEDEGDHDGEKGVGIGQGRRLAIGEQPELLEG